MDGQREDGQFDCHNTRKHFKSTLGSVSWIYIEILHIFYIYFFFWRGVEGPAAYVAKGSALSETSPTAAWRGPHDGSLTCTLIGWRRAAVGNSAPRNNAGRLRRAGGPHCERTYPIKQMTNLF